MQIKEIMTKEVFSVNINTPVIKIAELLTKKGIHGTPVVNKKNIVIGIITMSDFFIKGFPEIYLPSYINFIKKTKLHNSTEQEHKQFSAKLLKAKAGDIMTKDCVTVPEEMDVKNLLERYRTSSLKTIPVTCKEGILSGIIARTDIIKLIEL